MSFGASRLGVGIIGAGNVGPVLGRALAGAGHAITGVNAIGDEARERVEAMLPGVPILEVPEIVRRSELVLFAVPGSELPAIVEGLTKLGAWQPGQLAIHTAPEFGAGVFADAPGVIPIALTPAIVFTGTSLDLTRLSGAAVAVTAPAPVLPIGQALAVEMGAEPVVVAEADRPTYARALDAALSAARAAVATPAAILASIGISRPGLLLSGVVGAAIDEELRNVAGLEADPRDAEETWDERG